MIKLNKVPNTTPYGQIMKHDIQWGTVPVQEFNYKTREWEYAAEMIKKDRYYGCGDANEFKVLPIGSCRLCGKEVKQYETKYYKKGFDNGYKYCWLYDAASFFCEECAKQESCKEEYNNCLPREVDRWPTMRDNELVETVVYADGSRLEELTTRELAKMQPMF